ncbi:hypothetical protein [Clostridium septicum]|uniref:Uncharacterized protein n=1 Tax=Clostridium septicum TaxID=1504 RepID=A0ABY5B402_CLOSE|nr:hypothetical protein [Clostridium septicum]UEC19661.1 hypothetical protein LK444_09515 [Clostridium septicum]USS02278.1 hypothetical protein NH397_07660 [Clostridium septicum]WLF70861.1 hypothetical protein Q6375_07765 [Clostridium septicum]
MKKTNEDKERKYKKSIMKKIGYIKEVRYLMLIDKYVSYFYRKKTSF